MKKGKAPQWNLKNIYPGFNSKEYAQSKKNISASIGKFEKHLKTFSKDNLKKWLTGALDIINKLTAEAETLQAYASAVYTVDTENKAAVTELNAAAELLLPFAALSVRFSNMLASVHKEVKALIKTDKDLKLYSFYLEEILFWQKKQMSEAEEALAADLSRSGSTAWSNLQSTLTSTAKCVWDEKTKEEKTLVEVRAMAHDKNGAVREKAFKKELEICKSIEKPIAAALNGVKGATVVLNKRRNWKGGTIEKSVHQSNISQKTLDSLITAIEDSLPAWRKYLKAKASLLGKKELPFYDLFAPISDSFPMYSWEEAKKLVIENFSSFSERMGNFAKKAFASNWIDGEVRNGKVGGAYCTHFPAAKEPRVLCNFDGSFSSVSTLAHELGHAFHFDIVKDMPVLNQNYPMTLAETASIFAETILFESEIKKMNDEQKTALLEIHLQDGCQVLVDILSRFYFEKAFMEEREKHELTAEDCCRLMIEAQKKTYGKGLDFNLLHPYMWVVKSHYYSAGLAFYNFPYAFGQLFALGLYNRYKKEGQKFTAVYEDILRKTGIMDAVKVTKSAGFNIETPDFWKDGIKIFTAQIAEFEKLVKKAKKQ